LQDGGCKPDLLSPGAVGRIQGTMRTTLHECVDSEQANWEGVLQQVLESHEVSDPAFMSRKLAGTRSVIYDIEGMIESAAWFEKAYCLQTPQQNDHMAVAKNRMLARTRICDVLVAIQVAVSRVETAGKVTAIEFLKIPELIDLASKVSLCRKLQASTDVPEFKSLVFTEVNSVAAEFVKTNVGAGADLLVDKFTSELLLVRGQAASFPAQTSVTDLAALLKPLPNAISGAMVTDALAVLERHEDTQNISLLRLCDAAVFSAYCIQKGRMEGVDGATCLNLLQAFRDAFTAFHTDALAPLLLKQPVPDWVGEFSLDKIAGRLGDYLSQCSQAQADKWGEDVDMAIQTIKGLTPEGWEQYAIKEPDQAKIQRHLFADGVALSLAREATTASGTVAYIEDADYVTKFAYKAKYSRRTCELRALITSSKCLVSSIWLLKVIYVRLPAAANASQRSQVKRDARKKLRRSLDPIGCIARKNMFCFFLSFVQQIF